MKQKLNWLKTAFALEKNRKSMLAENLSTAEIALNIASIINFVALMLLLRSVLKNRNTLRGYSVSGCFLTFISILGFEIAYTLMGNYFSVILGLATVIFWFVAFIYSFKLKIKSRKENKPSSSGVTA
jgi:energy-converting hydrogenase Eha subunit A